MNTPRRVVRRADVNRREGIDARLWPVLVALAVLCGVTLGSMVTFLRGPMLWVGLLVLPIAAATTAYVLSLIENRWLRRSVQLGLLVSLAMHLAMLTGAFHTVIFGEAAQPVAQKPRTIQRRTIRRSVEFPTDVWNQVEAIAMPEVDQPQPDPQPQPTPTPQRPTPTQAERTPNVTPTETQRRADATPVPPRRDESLSQLSRQTARDLPRSSTSAETARTADVAQSTAAAATGEARVAPERMASAAPDRTAVTTDVPQPAAQATRRERSIETPVAEAALARSRDARAEPSAASVATESQITAPMIAQGEASPNAAPSSQPLVAQTTTAQPQGRTTAPELDPVRAPEPRLERRTSSEAAEAPALARSNASTPETPRRTPRPDSSERVEIAEASATPRPELSATAAVGGRNAAATDARPAASSASPETTAAASATTAERRVRSESSAAAAGTLAEAAAPRREARSAAQTDASVVAVEAPAATTAATTPAAAPATGDIARSTTSNQPQRQQAPSEISAQAAIDRSARTSRTEAISTTESIQSALPASSSPRRAIAAAPTPSSPSTVESPAIAASGQGDVSPSPDASTPSFSRAESGVAGRGRSPNLDSDAPASERPALQASNAARRESSTRAEEAGSALTASTASERARSRSESLTPSSTLEAETTANSTLAGAESASPLVASAGAMTTDSTAAVTEAAVDALQGSGEVDLGPPKVVSENALDRGSGGGTPEPTPALATLAEGPAPRSGRTASLAANETSEVPAAPLADGGGTPVAMEAAGDSVVASAAEDEEDDLVRGPTAGTPDDAASVALAGPAAEAARLSRAARETDGEGEQASAPLVAAGRRTGAADQAPPVDTSAEVIEVGGTAGATSSNVAEAGPSTEAIAVGQAAAIAGGEQRGDTSPGDPPADAEDVGGLAEASGPARRGRREAATAAPGALAIGGGDRRPASATAPATEVAADVTLGTGTNPGTEGVATPTTDLGAVAAGGAMADPTARAGGGATTRGDVPGSDPLPGGGEAGAPARRARGGEVAGEGRLPLASPGRVAADIGGPAETGVDLGQLAGGDTAAAPADLAGSGEDRQGGDAIATERAATGGVRVAMAAPEGPGGLGNQFSSTAGVNDRRARPEEGPLLPTADARFRRREAGATPDVDSAAAIATEAFRDRERSRGGVGGAGPKTEESIELGLAFLVRHQELTGNWRLERFGDGNGTPVEERPMTQSDTAATGLALLALQGAGYNHLEYRYAEPMQRAVDWLIANQKPDGDLYVETDPDASRYAQLYSHAIATLALCEAYGITQDERLKEPAQKALDFIEASQDRELGGWRYTPGRGADTSVTGWMMMALKSGRLAGLSVDSSSFERIAVWIEQAADESRPGEYRYNPYAPNTASQSHGRAVSPSMTSVGLLMRLYLGADRNDDQVQRGADSLLESLPSDEDSRSRDTYYWYYATQILRHMDGDHWKTWSESLRPLLIESQIREGDLAGSWDPLRPVPDRWSLHGGRLYLTTMNLLSLEVDYRLLPLYDDTVKDEDP